MAALTKKTNGPEWYFCEQCEDWIGSNPPFLPHLWTNDRAAALHRRANPTHDVKKVTADQLILEPKE